MSRIEMASAELVNTAWAITPQMMRTMINSLSGKSLLDIDLTAMEKQAVMAAATQVVGGVAVIPVRGVISHRMGIMQMLFGGTSTQQLTQQIREAASSESVGSIVLNVDSPGGSVAGLFEVMDAIAAVRGSKPIVAVANTLAASAAYGISSQADEIVVTPSGEVGSVGVIQVHTEFSKMDERVGITSTIIKAGQYKAEGNDIEPLSAEALEYFQQRVDETYTGFTARIAKGRGAKASAVRGEQYGEGRMYGPEEAVRRGMADRAATFEATLSRLAGPQRRRRSAQAKLRQLDIEANRA